MSVVHGQLSGLEEMFVGDLGPWWLLFTCPSVKTFIVSLPTQAIVDFHLGK